MLRNAKFAITRTWRVTFSKIFEQNANTVESKDVKKWTTLQFRMSHAVGSVDSFLDHFSLAVTGRQARRCSAIGCDKRTRFVCEKCKNRIGNAMSFCLGAKESNCFRKVHRKLQGLPEIEHDDGGNVCGEETEIDESGMNNE